MLIVLSMFKRFQVVGAPSDAVVHADGSALCAYQYFENLRNFLVAVEDLGLPTFELSDLEKVIFFHADL